MRTLEEAWSDLGTAFSKRTISLLSNQHARFYIALFDALFDTPASTMEYTALVERMNILIGDFAEQDEYRSFCPQENGEPKQAESIMRSLVDEYRWVEKSILQDGSVSCRLTSDAAEAMSIVRKLNERQTLMSGPRMQTIIDTVDRAKLALSNDYEEGLRLLKERLEQDERELDEYIATHGASSSTGFIANDIIHNLSDLIGSLPADISRYEEALRSINNIFRKEIAQNQGNGGKLTRAHYERRLDEELGQYRQSYRDAIHVKSSYEQGDSLFAALREIDFEVKVGEGGRSSSASAAWRDVTESISRVSSVEVSSSTLVNQSLKRMMEKDGKELTRAIAKMERACLRWADITPARGLTGFDGFSCRVEKNSVATDLGEPIADLQPDALLPNSIEQASVDMEHIARTKAPRPRHILSALKRSTASGQSVNEAFNKLAPEDRLLCELFGIMELSAHRNAELEVGATCPTWNLVDIDGNETAWRTRDLMLRTMDTPMEQEA